MSKDIILGGEVLMCFLEYYGVKMIFGYFGGFIMFVFDVLYDYREILNYILVCYE